MIKFLEKCDSPETKNISQSLKRIFKGRISLNPSVLVNAGCRIVALRVYNEHLGVIESMLIITKGGQDVVVNLSEYCKRFSVDYVADPKLFVCKDDVFITFNNGYVKEGNDIYILRVFPEIGFPTKCMFSGRETIEKNWGFYQFKEELFCIYSISPLRCLKAIEILEGEVADFCEVSCDYEGAVLKSYTIGTQPLRINNVLYVVVHKKISFLKKRIYLGRICKLHLNEEGALHKFKWSSGFLAHSIKSIFGNKKKFNMNLFSCTYFSGLFIHKNGKVMVSYGVNDLKSEVKMVDLDD